MHYSGKAYAVRVVQGAQLFQLSYDKHAHLAQKAKGLCEEAVADLRSGRITRRQMPIPKPKTIALKPS